MSRQPCVLINATIAVPFNRTQMGEAARAETIAQHLEEAVRKTTGVCVKKWKYNITSTSEE